MVQPQWRIVEKAPPASIDEALEVLLKNRGVGPSFLNSTLKDLEVHLAMRGMDEGAELMARHLEEGHKIVLVGDYDCDGITSVAQMSLFLREIGYTSYEVVIPLRAEGYGMPERALRDHSDAGLFVVMDCGTLDVKPISMVRALGADCIVIDHHEVPDKGLAPATVLINPKQPLCHSPFKEFCSSGLTLLFLARLRRALKGSFATPNLGGKYLALATIGTVADIVPLVDANRILTRSGLGCINARTFAPVQRIVEGAGITARTLTAGHVGYYVGPRINAAGRIADARIAFDLLMAEQPEEVVRLAQELNRLNARRQQQEDTILSEIRARFTEGDSGKRTLVMGDPKWPAGVIGIVASKIQQELLYGPTIILSFDESQGVARGSARSIPGFDIHSALKACDDLLLKWGGHKMAAGLTVALDRLGAFAQRFETVAREHPADIFFPTGKVDAELDLALVSPELLNALRQLEPHGMGNPTPTFAVRGAKVNVQKTFGRKRDHLRLVVDDRIGAIYWRGASRFQSGQWKSGELLDVVFQVEWDDMYGKPVLNVKDMGHFFGNRSNSSD